MATLAKAKTVTLIKQIAKTEVRKKSPKPALDSDAPADNITSTAPGMDQMKEDAARIAKKIKGRTAGEMYEEQVGLPVYSTGCIPLDLGIGRVDPKYGNGGVVGRTIAEIMGEPGVGKSLLSMCLIRSVQQRGKVAILLMTEEPDWNAYKMMGIDIDSLVVINAYLNDDVETADLMAETKMGEFLDGVSDPAVGIGIIDSIKSMSSALQLFESGDAKAGTERDLNSREVAPIAQLMDRFFHRWTKYRNDEVILVMINHMTTPLLIGRFANVHQPGEENRPRSSGGRRKEFESTLRLVVASGSLKLKMPHPELGQVNQPLQNYRMEYGRRIHIKIVKNRKAHRSGQRRVASNFLWETQSFDHAEDLACLLPAAGIVKREGNEFVYSKKNRWATKKKFVNALNANPKLVETFTKKLMLCSEDIFSYKSGGEKLKAKFRLGEVKADKKLGAAVKDAEDDN